LEPAQECHQVHSSGGRITIQSHDESGHVVVAVSDTGIGWLRMR
jgi:signal transduction histidine kinase